MSVRDDGPIPVEKVARLERETRALDGQRSFAEILGGFREEVDASGIADPDLDRLFESARENALAERQR